MRNSLRELMATALLMGETAKANAPVIDMKMPTIYPARGHKANVKRKRLRRIANASRRANRR